MVGTNGYLQGCLRHRIYEAIHLYAKKNTAHESLYKTRNGIISTSTTRELDDSSPQVSLTKGKNVDSADERRKKV